MKCPSIDYLLNGREDINWILDLEDEVHLIWDLWIYLSGLPECKGNDFLKVRRAGRSFWSGPENLDFSLGNSPYQNLPLPKRSWGGGEPHLGATLVDVPSKSI